MSSSHAIVVADEFHRIVNAVYESNLAMGAIYVYVACGIIVMIGKVVDAMPPRPEPEPEPEPIGMRICGPRRDLIALQRSWANEEAAPQQHAPHPATVIDTSADDAFATWFTVCIRLPDNPEPSDVIQLEHWVRSYTAFCNRNGFPRLSEADLEDRMREYAEANGSAMDQGVFIGGQLVG
jgi:hypothetical protein